MLQAPVAAVTDVSDIMWLTPSAWLTLQLLAEIPEFSGLSSDVESNPARFKEVCVYVCMHVCVCDVCMYVHVCMYACMYV